MRITQSDSKDQDLFKDDDRRDFNINLLTNLSEESQPLQVNTLDQEFDSFSFLVGLANADQADLRLVIDDLQLGRNHFLNNDIQAIVTCLQNQPDPQLKLLNTILNLMLNKKNPDVLVLLKYCLAIRMIIKYSVLLEPQQRMTMYRTILQDRPHYAARADISRESLVAKLNDLEASMKSRLSPEHWPSDSQESPFDSRVVQSREVPVLLTVYISQILSTGGLELINSLLPKSFDLLCFFMRLLSPGFVRNSVDAKKMVSLVAGQARVTDVDQLSKQDVEALLKMLEFHPDVQNDGEVRWKYQQLELFFATKCIKSTSIEKKLWAISVVTDRLRLIKINPSQSDQLNKSTLAEWIEICDLFGLLFRQHVHPELLSRSGHLLRFMNQNGLLPPKRLQEMIQFALKQENQIVTKLVHNLVISLEPVHLSRFLDSLVLVTNHHHFTSTFLTLLDSVAGSPHLVPRRPLVVKRGEPRMRYPRDKTEQPNSQFNAPDAEKTQSNQLQQRPQKNSEELEQQCLIKPKQEPQVAQPSQLGTKIFSFCMQHLDNHKDLIQVVSRLLQNQPAIFTLLSQYLSVAVHEDRPCATVLLESVLKLTEQRRTSQDHSAGIWSKSEAVTWLLSEEITLYLIAGLARHRYEQASIGQRLNLLAHLARFSKPLEQSHIEMLWQILGQSAYSQSQQQQFFDFVKDCLARGCEPALAEDALTYIYIQVLLKLQPDWFTSRVFECLEMFFLWFNQDCKLVSACNSVANSPFYQLHDSQLIGLGKFFLIYFRSTDSKVANKAADFILKLLAKWDSAEQTFAKLKVLCLEQIINEIDHNLTFLQDGFSKLVLDSPETHQLSKCLQLTIRLIRELQGRGQSDQQNKQDEITLNITNSLTEAMPPKKFILKASLGMTLRNLKDLVGSKLNPAVKGSKITFLTRGHYPKGQNLTLKQLRFENKQTLLVEAEQAQPKKIVDQQFLELLKSMFPHLEDALLRMVLEKRTGEDEQSIVQALLNDEIVLLYKRQLAEVGKHRGLAEIISSHSRFLSRFFSVLSLQNDGLRLQAWQLLSAIPNSPQQEKELEQAILQTRDWQRLYSGTANNPFQTLYNLQLLRNMIVQDQELSHKFVQNGGFQHVALNTKALLQNWTGQPTQAKLAASLLEVVKLYLKPHLRSLARKPLSSIFAEVLNYKQHLKDLPHADIKAIVAQLPASSQHTVTHASKSQKTFSFKAPSTHQTPDFKSPNDSGSNSPHSETPNDRDDDNLSNFSGSRSAKLRGSRRPDVFEVKLRHNVSVQLQLHQILNVHELTGLMLLNLRNIVLGRMQNQDSFILAQQILEVLLPSMLIRSAHELVYTQQNIQMLCQGVAYSTSESLRSRLVYVIFLLCVIRDLEEEVVIGGEDDELFQTQVRKIDRPRVFFVQQLLPFFRKSESDLSQSYFVCLTRLIRELQVAQLKELFDENQIISDAINKILSRPIYQDRDGHVEDSTLCGLLALLQTLMQRYPEAGARYQNLVHQCFNLVFQLPSSAENTGHPKCKRKNTRKRCFQLIVELCRQPSGKTAERLVQKLISYCQDCDARQFQSTTLRTEKYSGLRNLGATCYINSLLQQIHKNTPLPSLLANPEVIDVGEGHPLQPLTRLFTAMNGSLRNTVNPIEFIRSIKFHGQDINTNIQQDVNQFLLALVELFESNGGKDLLASCLMGEVVNQISGVGADKFVKKGSEPFFTISIDIKGKHGLHEGLQYFVKGDVLDGENMYLCEELGRKVKAVKRSYLRSLPNCLIFTLKRFQFDYNTMHRHKLNDYFEFPLELDLLKYSEQALSEQVDSLKDESYYKYKLVGVLVHSGTAESGHYYSYIHDRDKWWEFNDSLVTEFDPANMKAECFGGDDPRDWNHSGRTRNAYLLFYQKMKQDTSKFSQQLEALQPEGTASAPTNSHPSRGGKQSRFTNIIWKENYEFLKSRLVYDPDFIKFLDQLHEVAKIPSIMQLSNRLQGNRSNTSLIPTCENNPNRAGFSDCETAMQVQQDAKLAQDMNNNNQNLQNWEDANFLQRSQPASRPNQVVLKDFDSQEELLLQNPDTMGKDLMDTLAGGDEDDSLQQPFA